MRGINFCSVCDLSSPFEGFYCNHCGLSIPKRKPFHGYWITPFGQIISNRTNKPIHQFKVKSRSGKIYWKVNLSIHGKVKKFFIQRLMADTFLGCIYGYEVNHKDRNPSNNWITNLELLTPSENQKHWRNTK